MSSVLQAEVSGYSPRRRVQSRARHIQGSFEMLCETRPPRFSCAQTSCDAASAHTTHVGCSYRSCSLQPTCSQWRAQARPAQWPRGFS